jgi:VWFA-related protein
MKKLILLLIVVSAGINVFAQVRPAPTPGGEKVNKRPPQITETKPQNPVATETPVPLSDDEVIKVDTNLVTVPVKVSDRSGRFIAGLKKENFQVLEDGIEQEIAYFSNVEEPFTVALVLDMSPSSTFKLPEIQAAANAFIAQLRPRDKVMIVSFDAEYRVLAEATSDRERLKSAIRETKIESGTSLYETIDFVVNQKLKKIDGRKAIVLFSDGVDTTSIKADAIRNLDDVYELDVLIYPIEYNTFNDVQAMKNKPVIFNPQGNPIPSTTKNPFPIPLPTTPGGQGTTIEDYRKAHEYLDELANRTSGRIYRADNTSNLALAFSNIANELRQTYSLGYYPDEGKSVKKRRLKVRVDQKGAVVRARDSYVAVKRG